MKITFLGTASGTEPVANHHHTSLFIEAGGIPFFIDAGENCGYSAHLAGFDLLAVRDIFITHSHMDHIGGLANLLWYQRKLWSLDKENASIVGETVRVHITDEIAWQGVWQLLSRTESHFARDYNVEPVHYKDGTIYDSANLRIVAHHNHHLKDHKEGELWLSHSFRLEADDKVVVISGDVGDISDLKPLLPGADWLCMETGHHKVENVATYLRENFPDIRLCLYHHGRAMLADPIGEAVKGENILKTPVIAAEDGMTLNVSE